MTRTLAPLFLFACLCLSAAAVSDATETLDVLYERLAADVLASGDTVDAPRLRDTLRDDGTWPDVDYADRTRAGWKTLDHLRRTVVLACASAGPGGDPAMRRAMLSALDLWLERDFQNPNWWYNRIGAPRELAAICLLLGDDFTPARREKALPILKRAGIGMTGQNLVWVCEITLRLGVLERDLPLAARAAKAISREIRTSTGEGLQPDWSFHQHGPCLYSHGYGEGFAADTSRLAALLAGTSLAFSPEKVDLLTHYVLDGQWWMSYGSTPEYGAIGRQIARKDQSVRTLAGVSEHMLRLPTGRDDEFRRLAAEAAGSASPSLSGNRSYWRGDIMTHHRPGWYASARAYSTRTANTDGPANREGLKSHHISDGANFLYVRGDEYHDIFPVWDWLKIPGTTVVQREEPVRELRRMGETSFVGGVSDGTYGLFACDFARKGLAARKAWAFFDYEYVCLGAGIRCDATPEVFTTLNQCHLRTPVIVARGGKLETLAAGTHEIADCEWIQHDGSRYVFWQPTRVTVENDEQRGRWYDINERYFDPEESHPVFSAWLDHGSRPKDAGYAYTVVPVIDVADLPFPTARPRVRILSNTKDVQAVRAPLGITMAAFYVPGEVKTDGETIRVDRPCLLLWRKTKTGAVLAVSNPDNEAAHVRVRVSERMRGAGGTPDGAGSVIEVDLPGGAAAGSSVVRELIRQ